MKIKKKIMFICLMLVSFSYVAAQNVAKGTVVDTGGNPIPGVKVEIVGSTESVLTELDGTFELQSDAPFKKVRVVYSGMQTLTESIKPEMVIKMRKSNWWNRKPENYSWIISPQVAFPDKEGSSPSFGLMVARVKDYGFYGKFVFSPSENSDLEENFNSWPWTTGKDKRGYMAAIAGFIYRMKCPLHLYAGAGYVDRSVYWQLADGSYNKHFGYSYNGPVLDYGLMLRFGRFTINGGTLMSLSGGCNFSANVGLGFSY